MQRKAIDNTHSVRTSTCLYDLITIHEGIFISIYIIRCHSKVQNSSALLVSTPPSSLLWAVGRNLKTKQRVLFPNSVTQYHCRLGNPSYFELQNRELRTNTQAWILIIADTHAILLYTNRQSSPFHVFYWWRAYHVRLTKLDCLPRISARGR